MNWREQARRLVQAQYKADERAALASLRAGGAGYDDEPPTVSLGDCVRRSMTAAKLGGGLRAFMGETRQ